MDEWLIADMQLHEKQTQKKKRRRGRRRRNKAGYTATPVACGWTGAIIEVSAEFGQKQ